MTFLDFTTRRAALTTTFGCALLVYGLYSSAKIVFGEFGIDADTSHSLMLWYGIKDHGPIWLADWLFTQDNWLLSVVPFDFIGFAIFGPRARIGVAIGWLIFLLAAVLAASIAHRLGARKSAPWVCIALLNLGLYAHLYGFVSYSTSHNVTNLFGLGCLLALTFWAAVPRDRTLLLIGLLLTTGAVSDPWMLAAYNLPFFLGGLVALVRPASPISRAAGAKLMLVALFSIIATKTKLFGLFGFLPDVAFIPATLAVIDANTVFLIRDLGGLLNLVPIEEPALFLPGLVSITLIVVYLAWRTTVLFLDRRSLQGAPSVVVCVTALSLGGIITAFVISSVEAVPQSGRFLVNCAYLVVIVIAVTAEWRLSRRDRAGSIVVGCLLVLFLSSSIVSSSRLVWDKPFKLRDSGVLHIAEFLRSHDLAYGYGPYWGSLANAVTGVTKDQIRVRPVVFDPTSGRMITGRVESSTRWYTDEDVPAGTKRFFVIVKADGEVCDVVSVCIGALVKQFGKPIETLHDGAMTVLVWDHPLVGSKTPPLPVELGKTYLFGDKGEFLNGPGWAGPEPWGAWTDGDYASLRFRLDDKLGDNPVEMTIDSGCFLFGANDERDISVKVNGELIGKLPCDAQDNIGKRQLAIPAKLVRDRQGIIDLEFIIAGVRSPLELGASRDPRKLGIGLTSITFR